MLLCPAERATNTEEQRLREGLFRHDGVELLRADLAVLISVRAFNHLEELSICHGLAELLRHALQVTQRDVARLVVIKEVEHLLDVLTGVLVALFVT